MPITTPLTELLGTRHPILSAPMDTIAGSRLTRAISEAGGLGFSVAATATGPGFRPRRPS